MTIPVQFFRTRFNIFKCAKMDTFPDCIQEAWATYDAFRRLRYIYTELYFVTYDNGVGIELKVNNKTYSVFCGEYPDAWGHKEAQDAWKKLIKDIQFGDIDSRELKMVWDASTTKQKIQTIMKDLILRGFPARWVSGWNTPS